MGLLQQRVKVLERNGSVTVDLSCMAEYFY